MELKEQAKQLYQQSGGKMLLKDIAEQLGVKEGTLRSWKNRYKWDGDTATLQLNATQRKRSANVNRKAAERIEENEELTEREKAFCLAFIHAPNQSQAAMMTGRYKTYAAARAEAVDMMKKPAVIAEIKRLKAEKRAAMLADGDDVVEMHTRIAFADMSAFVEWGQEEVDVMGPFGPIVVTDPITKQPSKLKQIKNVVRFKEHVEVDGTVISEVKQGRDGASVKLVDRQKSLAFLERYFELNPNDRHKKDYDHKRLELEKQKQKAAAGEVFEEQDDGFIDAMKAAASGVWNDEENPGDVPV
jgi:phage terminase small subunit